MSDIRIESAAQLASGGAIVAAVGAAIVTQLPELQRYLRVRKM